MIAAVSLMVLLSSNYLTVNTVFAPLYTNSKSCSNLVALTKFPGRICNLIRGLYID